MNVRISEAEVISEFQKRKRRQIYISVLLVILMVPLFILEYTGQSELFQIPFSAFFNLLIAGVVLVILFSLKNWRCPVCNKYLGKNTIGIKFCKSCGTKLAE